MVEVDDSRSFFEDRDWIHEIFDGKTDKACAG